MIETIVSIPLIDSPRITERRRAVGLAMIGGVLLIFGGVISFDILAMLGINIDFISLGREFASRYFSGQYKEVVGVIVLLLTFVTSIGGFAVIIGGLLIRLNAVRAGRVFVQLGGGSGIFGLVVFLVIMLVGNRYSIEAAISGSSAIGTVCAFLSSRRAKKMLELPE
ncbi:MAG: hypothetical protein QXT63_00515 [Thermoplasmata archaeon]